MNKLFLIFFLLITTSTVAQQVEIPSINLSAIDFSIKITELDSTAENLEMVVRGERYRKKYSLKVENGKVDTLFSLSRTGNYTFEFKKINKTAEVKILPAWLSILPPLLAILLALIIREVLISIAAGIYLGSVFVYDFNPLIALIRMADTILLNTIINKEHMLIILFTLLIGGVVGIISRNGGTFGLATKITKLARNSRSGMLSSWLMGLVIFFDDYANTLIIGNMMRPITDKLKISREKLAYIVDSTSAPIASIAIISTWIGYELGLIADGLQIIGSSESAYDVFIQTLPYRFYPIAALFFVFLVAYTQKDFGPMYKAEKRSRLKGQLFSPGAEFKDSSDWNSSEKFKNPKWYNAAIPIFVILFGTIAGLYYTGINSLTEQNISDYGIQTIISNSDSYSSLLWASLAAGLVAGLLSISQKLMDLNEIIGAWTDGVKSMMFACIILVFAWGISDITMQVKTADYLVSILNDQLTPQLLPVLVFLICAAVSFSTGTSWGTMAIMMPLVIPLANSVNIYNNLDAVNSQLIIHGVISSVLTGSVFGDHCSPIADTTILSSMASKCNHIDHVKTQLPYALIIGIVCMLIGDLPTAYGLNPFISIGLIFILLTVVINVFGKRLPEAIK